MILTQEEAKVWGEILKGFSEGKHYEIPMVYKENLDGIIMIDKWAEITDFEVNHIPTITMLHLASMSKIDVRLIREKK